MHCSRYCSSSINITWTVVKGAILFISIAGHMNTVTKHIHNILCSICYLFCTLSYPRPAVQQVLIYVIAPLGISEISAHKRHSSSRLESVTNFWREKLEPNCWLQHLHHTTMEVYKLNNLNLAYQGTSIDMNHIFAVLEHVLKNLMW